MKTRLFMRPQTTNSTSTYGTGKRTCYARSKVDDELSRNANRAGWEDGGTSGASKQQVRKECACDCA
jgi:hypothetical protein